MRSQAVPAAVRASGNPSRSIMVEERGKETGLSDDPAPIPTESGGSTTPGSCSLGGRSAADD